MKRRVQILSGMGLVLMVFLGGCIANPPSELSVQSTVDAEIGRAHV